MVPTATTRSASPQRRAGRLGDLVPLAVDVVLVDELALQRAEGVEPDVEGHAGAADAIGLERGEQLRREVQAGGRGRRRTWRAGVDGLVALGRRGTVVDVGRQRHLAGRGHDGVRVTVEANGADPVGQALPHLDAVAAAERDRGAHRQAARGTHEGLPPVRTVVERSQHEHLRGAPAGTLRRQPGRDDARVVDDEQVTRAQPLPDVAESAVLERRRLGSVKNEQPGSVARLDRGLPDGPVGQVVVEVVDPETWLAHAEHGSARPGGPAGRHRRGNEPRRRSRRGRAPVRRRRRTRQPPAT